MAENKKKKQSIRFCDVLIVGSGSAGLRAAIDAHDAGAHVLIISKSPKEILTQCLQEGVSTVNQAKMDL